MINDTIDKKLVALFGIADPEQSLLEWEENLRLQDEILDEYYQRFEANSRHRYPANGFMTLVDRYKACPATLVFYGAGGILLNNLRRASYFGLNPDFLCDRNSQKAISNRFGLKAISLDELIAEHSNSYLLASTSYRRIYDDMFQSLVSIGFPSDRIYSVW